MTEQLRLIPETRESPPKPISRPSKFSTYYSIEERYSHVAGVLRQQAIFEDYMTNTGNDTLQFFSEDSTELLERDEENKDRAEEQHIEDLVDSILTDGLATGTAYRAPRPLPRLPHTQQPLVHQVLEAMRQLLQCQLMKSQLLKKQLLQS